jgi:hypothetical protein
MTAVHRIWAASGQNHEKKVKLDLNQIAWTAFSVSLKEA